MKAVRIAMMALFASPFASADEITGSAVDRLHSDAIFGNEIPCAISEMEERIPAHNYKNDLRKIEFEIPSYVIDSFDASPSQALDGHGACLQTYQGYKDGKRLHDLVEMLGQETIDMIVELSLFDFILNDCQWMKEWECTKDEWERVPKHDSGIFKALEADHGFLITEIVDWFSFWIEMEAKEGMKIYADSVIHWKVHVIQKFLSLKGLNAMKSDDYADLLEKKIKKHKKQMVEKKAIRQDNQAPPPPPPKQPRGRRRRLADDEESQTVCSQVDPVAFFGSKWSRISRFLKKYHGEDTSSKSSGGSAKKGAKSGAAEEEAEKAEDVVEVSTRKTLQTSLSFVTEACEGGLCVHVGTGFSLDPSTDAASIDWLYGLSTHRQMSLKNTGPVAASTKVNLRVHCHADPSENAFNDDLLQFTKMTTDKKDMERGFLYDAKNKEKMLGFVFSMGFGYDFDSEAIEAMENDQGEESIGFAYIHTGRLAHFRENAEDGCKDDEASAKSVGGVVSAHVAHHIGLYILLTVLSIGVFMLYRICHFDAKALKGEKEPLVMKSDAVQRIYTQEDSYGLLPKMPETI